MDSGKKYNAFISYKHNPHISKIAHSILRKLEHYRPPKDCGIGKRKLSLCIDDQNFAAAGVLNKQIYEALANSEYLIYLACPETLDSPYCLDEIRYFKKLHGGKLDNIIVLLAKGKPEDVLPPELCYEGCWEPGETPDPDKKTEIHWLDISAGNGRDSIRRLDESLLMIAAPLLHCEPDDLIQRDRQWKKLKRKMWWLSGTALTAVALCIIYTFWLTWSMDYKRQAEIALTDGDHNKALFYYAKVLSMNPFDEQAQINAQTLLQTKTWPMVVEEEADSAILGNRIYPIGQADGEHDFSTPVCITTKGDYILWTERDKRYYFTDADKTFVKELPVTGTFSYSGVSGSRVADAWCFLGNAKNPYYTLYWPEDNRMETLLWEQNFPGTWDESILCALRPGIIAIVNLETLAFYQLENGACHELSRIPLKELFSDDQSILEKYGVSLVENYYYGLTASPDGSRLVLSANIWSNFGSESFCHSAAVLFDTQTYLPVALAESSECLISGISFQDDSQKLALVYNNENTVLANRGYAAVYDCSGRLIFQTECSDNLIPRTCYFCGEYFLLSVPGAIHFLDAATGEQLCEPLMLHVNQAAMAEDGRIALEYRSGVRYCCFIRYSEKTNRLRIGEEDIAAAFRNEAEMHYPLADNLILCASGDQKEVLLTDTSNNVLDRFPVRNAESGNPVIALAYGLSTQTAFALDGERNLYCIPIDMENKKFDTGREVPVHEGVLAFAPAKHGVIFLDSYFPGYYFSNISNLNYITDNTFHNGPINYLGWITEPRIDGSFSGLISGESDYAVIVTQKNSLRNFLFYSVRTGDFLTNITLEATDDLFVALMENNIFYIRSDGAWNDIWLGRRRANQQTVRQLMDLSGYTLFGSRLKNNRSLEHSAAVMSPDSMGSWSEYLEWTYSAPPGLK